jgi:ribosome biogenesis GTPase
MKGLVVKSTGSWYTVLAEDGTAWDCRIKGKFRMQEINSTNPIAVGDEVDFDLEASGDEANRGVITEVSNRRNHIIRKSTNLSKQTQIIAANIDLALLVVTFAKPRTSFGFIDRFLVTAEAYHIPVLLVFNKIDIYEQDDLDYVEEVRKMYLSIGYSSYFISALLEKGMDELREAISDKTTLISGHSGVGKSTLINRLIPHLDLRTSAVSSASMKGVHTTTFAEMHFLNDQTKIIDTPGIRELGVVDINNEELSHFFPEMKKRINQCRFNNCMHINEPGCAIKEAVDKGEIALIRYESYLSILAADDNRK